ncbi:MAG TPA: ABC transporter substrate-binding protein [Candidatus Polarisedimenticolaceae bacterium]|nr:ABC transporter substrate-binding protein [Candidatus Polarisedimenticolaceae bacterium]
MSRRLTLLAAVFTLSLLGACSAPPQDEPPRREVRAVLGSDPASLSLLGKMDTNTEILAAQITDSLVQYDAHLELVPRVAESWELSDDRRTLTFRLREGVRWHDGRPVTADDVVFTVEKVRQPATENRTYAPGFDQLRSIEAPDARTVVARYVEIHPDYLDGWRVPLIPRHLAGRDVDLLAGEFAARPVGCGPFRFVSYRVGQEIVLEANDDYWDGAPRIAGLVFKIYPEQATAFQALLLGEIDVLRASPDQWQSARELRAGRPLDHLVYSKIGVWPVVWNQNGSNPFFTDRRVRQAMMHALDRDAFIDKVVHGLARSGVTTFHPDTVWANPELAPRPYDPALAGRLLDEAGWRDADGDGVREKDGRPFRFTLLVPKSPMELTRQIVVWQQDAWSRIGVIAEIEELEFQAFRERRNAGRFEAASFNLAFTPGPDQFFDLFHSSAVDQGWNFFGLADPEIDALLERGRATFDPAERQRLYSALQRLLYEQEPIGCTLMFSTPVLFDRHLRGIEPTPLGIWLTTSGPRLWHWTEPVSTGG